METQRFKAMWDRMQSEGYFENSPQYEDVASPLHRRADNQIDTRLKSLDYSSDVLQLPLPYSTELEASVLHTERHWLPRMFNLPPAGLAVDMGCGYGRSVAWLCKRYDQVIGFDISSRIIAIARSHFESVPNASFLVSEADRFPDDIGWNSAAFIYCFTVFQHIPRQYTASYLCEAFNRLRPGGLMVFNLISELNEDVNDGAFGSEWLIGYSEEDARKLVVDAGLTLEKLVRWTAPGAPGSWLWVGARKLQPSSTAQAAAGQA